MPIYEYRCGTCKTEFTELVRMGTKTHDCPECGNLAKQVILSAPKLDNYGIAMNGGGPEFQRRVDKMLRGRRDKELASAKEHGDYGPSAGYQKPNSPVQ